MSASKIFGSFEESHTPTDLQDKKKMKFSTDGRVRISEEVIAELASQALMKIIGVQPDQGEGGTRLAQGVDIMVEEEGGPSVVVDAYIRTKFGLMIPDIAWYVQESIRNSLEQNTGYNIKAVNVFVKGLYFEDVKKPVLEMTIKEKVQPSPPVEIVTPPVEARKSTVEEKKEEAPAGAPTEEQAPKKEKTSIFGKIEKNKP